jgi:hypothetical protein
MATWVSRCGSIASSGDPGFATLFFLVSAGGGVWPAIDILTSDEDPKKR